MDTPHPRLFLKRVILNTRQMPLWTVFDNRHAQSFDRTPPGLAVLFYDSLGKKNRKACEAVTRFLNYRCAFVLGSFV